MRTSTPLVLLAVAVWFGPPLGHAQETDLGAEECRAACARTAEHCATQAVANTEKCKETVSAPCKVWCPCTQFIGAAYFNCQLNCETCEARTAAPLAECDAKGKASAAECEAARRTCAQRCGS